MIGKLATLIDEKSILNFKFIFKLFKRYKLLVGFIPFIIIGFSLYFYKTQNQIHSGVISFRYLPESKKSPITIKSALMLGDEGSLDSSEILGVVSSTNFLQTLARDIHNDPRLQKFNFNSLLSKENLKYRDFVKDCQDEECELAFIRKRIPLFVDFFEDDLVVNKYNVNVKTLSRETTNALVMHVSENVKKYRLNTINFQLEGQIELTEKLLKKQETQLKELDVLSAIEEKQILENEITALGKKMSLYNEMLNEKKIALEQEEISLKYTKSTLKQKVSLDDKKDWKTVENLILKKEMLSADINALEHSLGENSRQDSLVINGLKSELARINKEILKFKGSKTASLREKFKDQKLESKDLVEFNIKVLKDHIDGLEASTSMLKREQEELVSKISKKDEYISEHQTTVDYYKLLQSKLLQIKLVKDTVVSDLVFDDYLSSAQRYKRYSLTSIIPFSIILSFFLMLAIVVIRYLFDNRLMDEEEFRVLFEDIPFIGEVPEYD